MKKTEVNMKSVYTQFMILLNYGENTVWAQVKKSQKQK
jgi:hypothetical protein